MHQHRDHKHHGHIHPIVEHVRENLASADPYYRGPHEGTPPSVQEEVRALDFVKTARDLGHLEPDTRERMLRLANRLPSPVELDRLAAIASHGSRRTPSIH